MFNLTADTAAFEKPPEQVQLNYSALTFFKSDLNWFLLRVCLKNRCFYLFMLAFIIFVPTYS